MKNEILSELIKKYLDHKCTPDEERLLYDWYEAFEGEEDPVSMLPPVHQQALKERMMERIKTNISGMDQRRRKRQASMKAILYTLSGAAAAALLLLVVTLFRPDPVDMTTGDIAGEITISNRTMEIHKQLLPDSSIVWLSPQSKIEYSEQFRGTTRTVKMTGEAFFQISRDPQHPFVIYSNGIVTKVLGTSFRIKSFDSGSTEISVATGKVSVKIMGKNRSEVLVLPDQQVTYLAEKQKLQKSWESGAAVSSMNIWKKASLSFDDAPVKKVVEVLNEKFNAHIFLTDKSIDNYSLNADFTDQNLPDILEMMETSLNINYEIRGDSILFTKINLK